MDHDPEIVQRAPPRIRPVGPARPRTEQASSLARWAGLAWQYITMPRDPLAVRYDQAAGKFVTRVLAAWDGKAASGGWVETTVTDPSVRVMAWAARKGVDPLRIIYTGRGSGIENANQAAFRRACYFDHRIYLWDRGSGGWGEYDPDRPRNAARVAALEFRWGRRTAAGRVARARAHSIRSASRYAKREDPYGR